MFACIHSHVLVTTDRRCSAVMSRDITQSCALATFYDGGFSVVEGGGQFFQAPLLLRIVTVSCPACEIAVRPSDIVWLPFISFNYYFLFFYLVWGEGWMRISWM